MDTLKQQRDLRQAEDAAVSTLVNLLASSKSSGGRGGKPVDNPKSWTATKDKGGRKSSPADLGITGPVVDSPTPYYNKDAAAMEASIEVMPAWVDKVQVKRTCVIKRRSSGKLMNEKNLNVRAQRLMRLARYNRAHKRATDEVWKLREDGLAGKHGNGLDKICDRYNFLYLSDPGDKKLT